MFGGDGSEQAAMAEMGLAELLSGGDGSAESAAPAGGPRAITDMNIVDLLKSMGSNATPVAGAPKGAKGAKGGGGGCMGKFGGGKGWGKDDWGKGKGKDKGKDKGKGAVRLQMGEQCYHGKIKTYDAEKQRGYIVCEEVFNMCGSDVYVFGKVLEGTGAGPGDTVAFFLHWSATSGQPQASAPLIRVAAAESYALKGTYKAVEGKDHGFLQCDVTKEFFGRDVYVNKDVAALMETGATIAFNTYLNRDKMPNVAWDKDTCQGCEMCEDFWEPTPSDLTVTRTDADVVSKGKSMAGKGKDGKGGKGKGGKDSWGGSGWVDYSKGKGKGYPGGETGPAPKATGETFYGILKSFNEKTNYGFIACDDCATQYGGGDCFFSGRHLNGMSVGDMVEFDVGLNGKGKPQAIGMRPVDMDPAAKRPKLA